jgi:hypothetical protein
MATLQAFGHDRPDKVEKARDAGEGREEGDLVDGRIVVETQRQKDRQTGRDGGQRRGRHTAVELPAKDLIAALELPRAVSRREEPPHVVDEARHQPRRPLA